MFFASNFNARSPIESTSVTYDLQLFLGGGARRYLLHNDGSNCVWLTVIRSSKLT